MQLLGVLFLHNAPSGQNLLFRHNECAFAALPSAEVFFHQRLHLRGLIVARQRHHCFSRQVVLVLVVHEVLAGVRRDLFRRPQNRLPQRLRAKLRLCQQVMHQIFGRVLVHRDFFQHNAAFLVQLLLVHRRVHHHVSDNVDGELNVLVDDLGVAAGAVLAREGVQLPADRVHFLGNLPDGALRRSLENHVLNEVGEAVFFRRFHHRTHMHPRADRHRPQMRQAFPQHTQAIGQHPFITHTFISSRYVFQYAIHLIPF